MSVNVFSRYEYPLNQLICFDTTLRDGDQSPGVAFTINQKREIARNMRDLGVNVLEIGFPACNNDYLTIEAIINDQIEHELNNKNPGPPMILCCLSRCVSEDINIVYSLLSKVKYSRIHLFYATSDIHLQYKLNKTREEALIIINNNIRYAKEELGFKDIQFSLEDATRTSIDYCISVSVIAIKAGANTINLPDTVGNTLPHLYTQFVEQIIKGTKQQLVFQENIMSEQEFNTKIIWSSHCHNDLGLATANSLSGIRGGCRQVEGTINGIGERAGNCALEEILITLTLHSTHYNNIIHTINTQLLVPISELVSEYSGLIVQKNKAIVGRNSVIHESGVHVNGIIKNRKTYELFDSSLVGWNNSKTNNTKNSNEIINNNNQSGIVLGKHTGRSGYRYILEGMGCVFDNDNHINNSFRLFQSLFLTLKPNQQLTDQQLIETVEEGRGGEKEKLEEKNKGLVLIELLGDGISVEVTKEARKIIDLLSNHYSLNIKWKEASIGGRSIDECGSPLSSSTIKLCKESSGVLLGAVGDPKYGPNSPIRPEQGLLLLREELELFNNLRPLKVYNSLIENTGFKSLTVKGVEIIIVRELLGGVYNQSYTHTQTQTEARDLMVYKVTEIERIIRAAAQISMKRKRKLISLDKANVLACSRLWRETANRIIKEEFPLIQLEHQLIDSAAMMIIKNPKYFDVVVTENLFGDIISDEIGALSGSLGLLGSISLGENNKISLAEPVHGSAPDIANKGIANPIGTIVAASLMFRYSLNREDIADIIDKSIELVLDDGYGTIDIVKGEKQLTTIQMGDAIADKIKQILIASSPFSCSSSLLSPPLSRRPMNVIEKMFLHQSVGLKSMNINVGDIIIVKVSNTLASEMTLKGIKETWKSLGSPKLWRNDRFLLSCDHTTDPSNYNKPFQKELIEEAERFASIHQLIDYYPPNQSILHTEFYRQRVIPGSIIIGADSHSCSAGCLSSFAAGLGAADCVLPLLTGQTFFSLPETLLIHFKYNSELSFGLLGKDIMLYLLQQLKRNTVAFERAIEYNGNIKNISIDSRFALSNMATEFGGIAGVWPSDYNTLQFIENRNKKRGGINEKDEKPLFFDSDANAKYAYRYELDLSLVAPLIAKYPSPDNVYSINDEEIDRIVPEIGRSIRNLDGVFIGSCTTTEEELILAGLLLKEAMKKGLKSNGKGIRKVVCGSVIMSKKLEEEGIWNYYREAGFEVGIPACSYCLGVGADIAPKGTVWLSSQNRNFRNRMGAGSIGNLASACTVAISSFNMRIRLKPCDKSLVLSEPNPCLDTSESPSSVPSLIPSSSSLSNPQFPVLKGGVQRFGDNIDTDAIIPGQYFLVRPLSKLGLHSFAHVRPDFIERLEKKGRNIIVAGEGFGSGSSREEAVSCLIAAGVKCLIAKSFAFIFARNLLCLNLIGITIKDERFYNLAKENAQIEVDLNKERVLVREEESGEWEEFSFSLSPIQKNIYNNGGIIEMYRKQGNELFESLAKSQSINKGKEKRLGCCSSNSDPYSDLNEETEKRGRKLDKPLDW